MKVAFDLMQRSLWVTIGVAVFCGAVVGLERQVRGKPAGIRTSILVCLGTALFVYLARAHAEESGDAIRVLGQVVTGVGFLGAGVMFTQDGVVTGATTAAVIWILAALGAVAAFGHHESAAVFALLVVAILGGVEVLETTVRSMSRGVHRRGRGRKDGRPAGDD